MALETKLGKIDDLLLAVLLAVLLHLLELEIITSAKIECLVQCAKRCRKKLFLTFFPSSSCPPRPPPSL